MLTNYFRLFTLYRRRNRAFAIHDYHTVFLVALQCLRANVSKPLPHTHILEIGCGQRFGATLLFHSLGASIIGIDYDPVSTRLSWSGLREMAASSGLGRALKSAVRRILFDHTYYAVLERELGRPLQVATVDIRQMDARALAFNDSSFDFIFSNAVFEHVDDVDAATQEVARVLVPGGIARIAIHLFPSLSGGHHPAWAFPDEHRRRRVPPWDHLRDRRCARYVYLNEMREADYLAVFRRHLAIQETTAVYEGRRYLSEPLRRELRNYTEEDLLKRSITVVLRKALDRPKAR